MFRTSELATTLHELEGASLHQECWHKAEQLRANAFLLEER